MGTFLHVVLDLNVRLTTMSNTDAGGCTEARMHGCTNARMHGGPEARRRGGPEARRPGGAEARRH
eukprot:9305437-Alexandrium_andersonii.AAC.1